MEHFLATLGMGKSTGDFETSLVNFYNQNLFKLTGNVRINTETPETVYRTLSPASIVSITDSELLNLFNVRDTPHIKALQQIKPASIEIDRVLLKSKSLSDSQLALLEAFILTYLIGPGYTSTTTHFTFDANNADIKTIMKNSAYVRGLKTPQNIADSAVTSDKNLSSERDDWYYFPTDDASSVYTAKQNTFTRDSTTIQYTQGDTLYTKETPFNFAQDIINRSSSAKIGLIPYSKQMSSGPSLDYLAQCVVRAATTRDFSGIPFGKFAPFAAGYLKPGAESIPFGNLFFDIKRLGDHEQVRAALQFRTKTGLPVVFCTLDKACALYARMNDLPCALWSKEKLILYRSSTALPLQSGGHYQIGGVVGSSKDLDATDITFIHELAGIAATYVNSFICDRQPRYKLYSLLEAFKNETPDNNADMIYKNYLQMQITQLGAKLGVTDFNTFYSTYKNSPISLLKDALDQLGSESPIPGSTVAPVRALRGEIIAEFVTYVNDEIIDKSKFNTKTFYEILTDITTADNIVIYALAILNDILSKEWEQSLFNLPVGMYGKDPVYFIPKTIDNKSITYAAAGVVNLLGAIISSLKDNTQLSSKVLSLMTGGARRRRTHRHRRRRQRKTRQRR